MNFRVSSIPFFCCRFWNIIIHLNFSLIQRGRRLSEVSRTQICKCNEFHFILQFIFPVHFLYFFFAIHRRRSSSRRWLSCDTICWNLHAFTPAAGVKSKKVQAKHVWANRFCIEIHWLMHFGNCSLNRCIVSHSLFSSLSRACFSSFCLLSKNTESILWRRLFDVPNVGISNSNSLQR